MMSAATPIFADRCHAGGNADAAIPAHLPALDGWRGAAILLVLGGHFLALGDTGLLGVELFFVLSGRLMAEILVARQEPLGRFLRRRASRILPAYLVFIACMSLVGTAVLRPEAAGELAFSSVAALFLFSNYLMDGGQLAILFTHSWSLAVEEHSYLLLALIVLLARRRRGAVLAVAAAAACAAMLNGLWQYLADPAAGWLYARTDIRLASIFISFSLCLTLQRRPIPDRLRPILCPLALLGGSAVFLLSPWEPLSYTAGTLLLAVAVNSVEYVSGPLRRFAEEPVLRWFGLISFSLYLWQQLFYVAYLGGTPVIGCVAGALMCGAMSFYGIERPARRYFNSMGSPSRPSAAR
jgi:peptidoglycan/LPS O-acetylase OafA/YrhL